jgi:hypothetical protein
MPQRGHLRASHSQRSFRGDDRHDQQYPASAAEAHHFASQKSSANDSDIRRLRARIVLWHTEKRQKKDIAELAGCRV